MKEVDLTQKRDFGGVLNASFAFAKQEFGLFFKTLMTYTAIPMIGAILLIAYLAVQLSNGQFQSLIASPSPAVILSLALPALIFYLLMIALYVIVTGISFGYINAYNKLGKGNFSVSDVGRQMARKFFPIVGYSIVVAIVTVAGFILFIIPGIYLAIPLSLIFVIMFVEDKGLAANFNRCFTVIKDNWWVTFGLIIIASLVVNVAGTVFFIPFQMYLQVKMLAVSQTGDLSQINIPLLAFFFTLMIVGSLYLRSFIHLVIGIQYFNLTAQSSTESIEDRINNIGERSVETSL